MEGIGIYTGKRSGMVCTSLSMYMSTPYPPSGSRPTVASSATSDPPRPYTNARGITLDTPLVRTDQVKTHLCLLRAFKDLRTLVEGVPATSPQRMWPELARELSPSERWRWFVEIAVDRYVHRLGLLAFVNSCIQVLVVANGYEALV